MIILRKRDLANVDEFEFIYDNTNNKLHVEYPPF